MITRCRMYYFSPNIMAEALDESFNSLEELEISQIGEFASICP